MDEWREWMIQTFSEDKSNFVTAERNADGWNFNRFTCNPFAKEITRLQSELAEARDKALDEAAEAMESLSFFTDVSDLIGMTKQEMSVHTCHEGAQAIRALKSPKPPIL